MNAPNNFKALVQLLTMMGKSENTSLRLTSVNIQWEDPKAEDPEDRRGSLKMGKAVR